MVPWARTESLLPSSRRDLLDWLAEGRRRGAPLPSPRLARFLDAVIAPCTRAVIILSRVSSSTVLGRWRIVRYALARLRQLLTCPYCHHRYIVHWAVERAKQRYGAGKWTLPRAAPPEEA